MDRIKPALRMPALGVFLTLGALITFFITLGSPSDPKNSFLFGYSLERIILGAGLLFLGIASLFLTWKLVRDPERSQRIWERFTQPGGFGNISLLLAFVLLLSCWIILFLPSYRLGRLAGYVERLSPIIIWLAVIGAVMTVVLILERKGMAVRSADKNRTILKSGAVFMGMFIILALIVAATGIGVRYPADYWYGAGVPVLGLQVLFSLLAGALVLLLEQRFSLFNKKRLDLFFFLGLWIIAAWFWAREPLSPNYFMPDTSNNVIYPYSDGATFDQGGQYALIGQGLFNGYYFERVLYSIFLVYLHMLFGQDFVVLMTVQAALFAVFPSVVYLLGRELHSRALGVSAGILIAARGLNAIIVSRWIDTASPKMVLTDFLTALGIAVFLLLLVKWIKEPPRVGMLVWAGAVMGLTLMVRSHALTLLPVALIFIPLFLKMRWKQVVMMGLLIVLGMIAVTFPWELRNQSRGIPMYSMYYSRIVTILRYRYGFGEDAYIPPRESEIAAAQSGVSSRGFARQRVLDINAEPFCDSALCSIANHFLHNTVTSFVSLPVSLAFDDLWNTVKADTPYWKKDWNEGTIGTLGASLMLLNIVVISLGIGSVWGRVKALALLPILFFAVYLFTNSIGLTSGGRYIAPVDWIVYLFFMAGGLQIAGWLLNAAGFSTEPVSEHVVTAGLPALNKQVYSNSLIAAAFVLALGMLLPVSEMFHQPRYQVREPEEILAGLEEAGLLQQTGYSRDDLLAFLEHPDARIQEGRALYPRYYRTGEGEQDRSTYYRFLDYQRLVFTLIGPYSAGVDGVVIPGDALNVSMHTADVIVLGCYNTTYYSPFIDAVVVFVTSDGGYVYNRAPQAPLQCPLPEP